MEPLDGGAYGDVDRTQDPEGVELSDISQPGSRNFCLVTFFDNILCNTLQASIQPYDTSPRRCIVKEGGTEIICYI